MGEGRNEAYISRGGDTWSLNETGQWSCPHGFIGARHSCRPNIALSLKWWKETSQSYKQPSPFSLFQFPCMPKIISPHPTHPIFFKQTQKSQPGFLLPFRGTVGLALSMAPVTQPQCLCSFSLKVPFRRTTPVLTLCRCSSTLLGRALYIAAVWQPQVDYSVSQTESYLHSSQTTRRLPESQVVAVVIYVPQASLISW